MIDYHSLTSSATSLPVFFFFFGFLCTTTAAVTAATGYFIINAPHGDDDMMDSPQLCIVPATLVSGDSDGVDTAGVPLQSALSILSQVNYLITSSHPWLFFFRFWIKRPSSVNEIPLHPGSPEQRKTMLQRRPLVQLPSTTPPTYPLAVASSSLTTLYNNSSCSNLALGPIQTHGIRISFLRLPDWKMEVGRIWLSETTMTGVYFWRYPWWINDFGKQVFIS